MVGYNTAYKLLPLHIFLWHFSVGGSAYMRLLHLAGPVYSKITLAHSSAHGIHYYISSTNFSFCSVYKLCSLHRCTSAISLQMSEVNTILYPLYCFLYLPCTSPCFLMFLQVHKYILAVSLQTFESAFSHIPTDYETCILLKDPEQKKPT